MPLGLAIFLPIMIVIFAHKNEEMVVSSSNIAMSLGELGGNPAVKISLPDGKSSDALREGGLIRGDTQSQEEKEPQAQKIPIKKEMRVSSRRRIHSTGKLRTREKRGKLAQEYKTGSQPALITLPVNTPISTERGRERRIRSQPAIVDGRKRELENQLRTNFLLGVY
jgi:hypothetical protein